MVMSWVVIGGGDFCVYVDVIVVAVVGLGVFNVDGVVGVIAAIVVVGGGDFVGFTFLFAVNDFGVVVGGVVIVLLLKLLVLFSLLL